MFRDEDEETTAVGKWIGERAAAGVLPHEFGVFVRSAAQLDRARAVVERTGLTFKDAELLRQQWAVFGPRKVSPKR